MLGEEIKDIWNMLGSIHSQPQAMKMNAIIAARLIKERGLADARAPARLLPRLVSSLVYSCDNSALSKRLRTQNRERIETTRAEMRGTEA